MPEVRRLSWAEIPQAPDRAGVYAWYFSPEITQLDLDVTVERVRALLQGNAREQARQVLEDFFQNHIFTRFRRDAYDVSLRGPLMPEYRGPVNHVQAVSVGLTNRLLDRIENLAHLRRLLEASAPHFAAPLYIGMAESLMVRLRGHVDLIKRYRDRSALNSALPTDELQVSDATFAERVVARQLSPDRLFVLVQETEALGDFHTDLEHVLNRICFPILGRN